MEEKAPKSTPKFDIDSLAKEPSDIQERLMSLPREAITEYLEIINILNKKLDFINEEIKSFVLERLEKKFQSTEDLVKNLLDNPSNKEIFQYKVKVELKRDFLMEKNIVEKLRELVSGYEDFSMDIEGDKEAFSEIYFFTFKGGKKHVDDTVKWIKEQ